ncbi:hypothetical protein C0J52_16531, partial [Blattella germanica]
SNIDISWFPKILHCIISSFTYFVRNVWKNRQKLFWMFRCCVKINLFLIHIFTTKERERFHI